MNILQQSTLKRMWVFKRSLWPSFCIEVPISILVFEIFQKGLGTQVKISTTFHPQTDFQEECTIQTIEDMLRACVSDFKENWYDQWPLIEFSYNNSCHSIISMAPFEAFYGRRYRFLVGLFEVGESLLLGPEIIYEAIEKVQIIRDRLKTAYSQ